jgi:hypothetical protein
MTHSAHRPYAPTRKAARTAALRVGAFFSPLRALLPLFFPLRAGAFFRTVLFPVFLFLLLSLPLTQSCSGNQDSASTADTIPEFITSAQIERTYDLYVAGNYPAYVAAMLSCDDKPDAYRRQMATLLKQHAREIEQAHGRITSFTVSRIDTALNGRAANVYLSIDYASGKSEEIFQQYVHDGTAWRLR